MHEAVEDENVEVVKLLMSRADINVNAKDENGKTPLDLAKNEEIKKILQAKNVLLK